MNSFCIKLISFVVWLCIVNMVHSQTIKGYVIVQETSTFKTRSITTDTIYLTENYYFSKSRFYIQGINHPTFLLIYVNFKTDSAYSIAYLPPTDDTTYQAIGAPLEGKHITSFAIDHNPKCLDSIIYLKEKKKIEGFIAQKAMFINRTNYNDGIKRDPVTIVYIASKLELNRNPCYKGMILESEDSHSKKRTLQITEKRLPNSMDWILEGKNNKELEERADKLQKIYPNDIPSEEELMELVKKLQE